MPFMKYKRLNIKLRVCLAGYSVAMVTYKALSGLHYTITPQEDFAHLTAFLIKRKLKILRDLVERTRS